MKHKNIDEYMLTKYKEGELSDDDIIEYFRLRFQNSGIIMASRPVTYPPYTNQPYEKTTTADYPQRIIFQPWEPH